MSQAQFGKSKPPRRAEFTAGRRQGAIMVARGYDATHGLAT